MRPSPPRTSRVIRAVPFYYGWIVLGAAMFGMFMTMPGQTAGISVFLDKIIEDLGISRTEVSFLYAVATLGGAATLTFVGRAVDRFGARVGVVVVGTAFGLACLGMALVTGPWSLLVGFLLIRGLGQGALQIVNLHAVNQWFVRRRGLAVGTAGLGIAVGTAGFPPIIEWLLTVGDWRFSYIVLGGAVLVLLVPVGALLFRDRPETFGIRPDGDTYVPSDRAPRSEPSIDMPTAARTVTFWLYTVGGFAISALGTGLVFHHYAILAGNGVERTVAATMFVAFGAIMAAANLASGYLMDRLPPRYLLAADQVMLASALVGASLVSGPMAVLVYGAVLGTSQGAHAALQAGVYAHYFGRAHYGAIKGLAATVSIAGTAFGPWLFATGFARFDVAPTLIASALLPAAVAFAAPWLRPPRPPAPCTD